MPQTDAWRQFLTQQRIGVSKPTAPGTRSEFHKDYDRIIFSSAFRRLSEKTQVVPFPESAYTRQRLTHSLEVSCVGRSLATHVYHLLPDVLAPICSQGDFEAIVAAACLAHDIGNPPFGHFGERAVQDWAEAQDLSDLSADERSDLTRFEGNAQSFRILTRLQMSNRPGGMRLTAATLGALIKYPTFSKLAGTGRHRKHGCFEDDRANFEAVFAALGRPAANGEYARHPLAFLSEAADDICYAIVDLEDGCKSGLIAPADAFDVLEAISGADLSGKSRPDAERLGLSRALAIGTLVDQSVRLFHENSDAIVDGTFSGSLIGQCPSADRYRDAKDLVVRRVFRNERVLELEAAGYRAIQGLLNILVPAALTDNRDGFQSHVLALAGLSLDESMSKYQRILAATDYVSGLTDRYCLELYRKLSGHGVI